MDAEGEYRCGWCLADAQERADGVMSGYEARVDMVEFWSEKFGSVVDDCSRVCEFDAKWVERVCEHNWYFSVVAPIPR